MVSKSMASTDHLTKHATVWRSHPHGLRDIVEPAVVTITLITSSRAMKGVEAELLPLSIRFVAITRVVLTP